MKISSLTACLILVGSCFAVNAAMQDNVMVYASARSDGSMSAGAKSFYTKTFDVSITNMSNKTIDLSKYCLTAYSPDHQAFKLDTVDDMLTNGKLNEGKSVKGQAVFSSESEKVYHAAMIKIKACQ
ncbi:DUF4354 family protein [Erwinia rhapontici]|uniref:DUF4354 family protein n=1 Tax=Erwinia rhapontici TaxID=55212 RepID=UPI001D0DB1A0|nr:DUF4354 family protein [Erwinia rhapontici]UDQ82408.1 DUF4354 family protein [Erwinia rhapontici]